MKCRKLSVGAESWCRELGWLPSLMLVADESPLLGVVALHLITVMDACAGVFGNRELLGAVRDRVVVGNLGLQLV